MVSFVKHKITTDVNYFVKSGQAANLKNNNPLIFDEKLHEIIKKIFDELGELKDGKKSESRYSELVASLKPLLNITSPNTDEAKQLKIAITECENIIKKNNFEFSAHDKRFIKIIESLDKKSVEDLDPEDKDFYFTHFKIICTKEGVLKKIQSLKFGTLMKNGEKEFGTRTFEEYNAVQHLRKILEINNFVNAHKIDMSDIDTKLDVFFNSIDDNPSFIAKTEDKLSPVQLLFLQQLPMEKGADGIIQLLKTYQLEGDIGENFKLFAHLTGAGRKLFQQIEAEMISEMNLSPGTIGFTDIHRHAKASGRAEKTLELLISSTTNSPYAHALMIMDNREISHIMSEYLREAMNIKKLITNDFFSFNWDKLTTPETQEILKKVYGEEWQKTLENKYEEASIRFHHQDFSELYNEPIRRFASVIKLETKWHVNNPSTMKFDHRKLFCSEFVAKSLAATLEMLENEIKADALEKHIDDVPSIIMPFPKNMRYSGMHPGKLMKYLEPYIIKKSLPKTLVNAVAV